MKSKILSLMTSLMVMFAVLVFPAKADAASYGSADLADRARQVAAIVNNERQKNGLAPLKFSDELSEAALVRAQEIQTYFSHTRPDGRSCFTAVTDRGIRYRSVGENIAYGQRSAEEVMRSWMNSSGHRANILSSNYDYIGVGVTYRNGVYYWTQFFARSDDLTGYIVSDEEESEQTTTAPVTTTLRTTKAQTTALTTTTTRTTTTAVTTAAPEASPEPESSCIGSDLLRKILERFGIRLADVIKIIK